MNDNFVQVNLDSRYAKYRPIGYLVRDSGCWEWATAKDACGYGLMRHNGRTVRAHRWMFERAGGVIPDGMQLDHLCRNTSCVNPRHLEPVTHTENMKRGTKATKTHCAKGHALTEDNTYLYRGRDWRERQCKQCRRTHQRAYDKGKARVG